MRFGKFLLGVGSTLLVSGAALATPMMTPLGGALNLAGATPTNVVGIPGATDLPFAPLQENPGKIGEVAYAAKDGCILTILGGGVSGSDVDDVLLSKRAPNSRSFKKAFAVHICGSAQSGWDLTVANSTGLRNMLKNRISRTGPSSAVVAHLDVPNAIIGGSLGNEERVGAARFISNEFEVVAGTDANKELYLVIVDRMGGKLIHYTSVGGGYSTDLTAQSNAVYHRSVRQFAAMTPMIMLFNPK